MLVGTAGHIDHGKTSLVKALTGVDCDRLKEEKARGITLDLGYAYLACAEAPGGSIGFIDVPGHERLIHTMLAGSTGIDFALLVIAADDGPMPQTREHLEIIELLGLRHGAVALTKIDTVDGERRSAVQGEVADLLAASGLDDWPVFPVCAHEAHDAGVAALRDRLFAAARSTRQRAQHGHFRLAVDRAFSLSGVGTVVTGTAAAGRVRVGDTLRLSPSGRSVRVRSLRVHDRTAESGGAGERIALALAGIEKNEISRGNWLHAPNLFAPQARCAVRLRVLPQQGALAHWTPVHVHLGADDIPGRIALLEGEILLPGSDGLAELQLDRPVGLLAGDRFVLRDAGARRTLAGGDVLDIFPPSRHKRRPERLALLRTMASGAWDKTLAQAAEQALCGADLTRFALNANLDAEASEGLVAACGLRRVGNTVFSPAHWRTLAERLRQALAEEHQRAPDMPGVERDRLRRLTWPALERPAFDVLLDKALNAGEVTQHGAWLHLPGHRVQLAAADRELWALLAPQLAATPFNPPRVRELAQTLAFPEERVRQTLKRIARCGDVYPVAHDHYFSAAAVETLAASIARLCEHDGAALVARLRDEIGGGRKVAIQILEFFDRIGYTRRVRDSHVLRQGSTLPTMGSGREACPDTLVIGGNKAVVT